MKKWIWIILIIAVISAGGVTVYFLFAGGPKKTTYQFTKVERGNLESTVSCTGTMQFLNTENVIAQVSGTVKTLGADYNQKVRKGQVLAVLDSTLLKLNLQDAVSTLQKNKVLLEQSQKDYNETKDLFTNNFKSTNDMQTAEYNLRTAHLNYDTAKTALDIARLNLNYTVIASPLTGIVVQRNANVGDSVTANNTASPVFVVASDIDRMQILASVDESDISKIKPGQKVYFTVESFQDRQFEGKVFQVRLATTTVQNVVTYTVVVNVENVSNLLLPGMTATLDLVSESRTNVLKVPSSAFKFMPPQELVQKSLQSFRTNGKGMTNSLMTNYSQARNGTNRQWNGANRGRNGTNSQSMAVLWTTNENGLKPIPVKKGFTDGVNVEITGKDLTEGLMIISGIQSNKTAVQKNAQRSLLPTGGDRGGPGGPGGPH